MELPAFGLCEFPFPHWAVAALTAWSRFSRFPVPDRYQKALLSGLDTFRHLLLLLFLALCPSGAGKRAGGGPESPCRLRDPSQTCPHSV